MEEGVPHLCRKGDKPGKGGGGRENHSRLKEWGRGMWYIQKVVCGCRYDWSIHCLLAGPIGTLGPLT